MSKLGLLIMYAKTQRSIAYMTAGRAVCLRCGVWSGKEAWKKKRSIKFQKTQIEQRAQFMKDVVKCRLIDIEDNRNELLIAAIDRLSEARLKRIEYAGRVLP